MLKEKVIQFLKDNPNCVNMNEWLCKKNDCGTVGCLAGIIVHVAGARSQAYNNSCVPVLARHIWAKEYGMKNAGNLPFYLNGWYEVSSVPFHDVRACHLVEYLESL